MSDLDGSELVALRQEVTMLRVENELLKKRERDRWASAEGTFGERYSTVSDQRENVPTPNFGTRRPGFFK